LKLRSEEEEAVYSPITLASSPLIDLDATSIEDDRSRDDNNNTSLAAKVDSTEVTTVGNINQVCLAETFLIVIHSPHIDQSRVHPPNLGVAPIEPLPPIRRSIAYSSLPRTFDYVPNRELSRELWFHGPISRREAELLLHKEGDFLVRMSQLSRGQFVLSGYDSGRHVHLILVSPDGRIVNHERHHFESISHLISYHMLNRLPVRTNTNDRLLLRNPIGHRTPSDDGNDERDPIGDCM